MSQVDILKDVKAKINDGKCTIQDLKDIYEKVNTAQEVIVAQKGDIKHLYYRNHKEKTVSLEENLLPYEKNISVVRESIYYPMDLCIPVFYDEDENRYGQGVIIPRIQKFVMVDDMDLIKEPPTETFYTSGTKEDNKNCASLVDRAGNLYRMSGYSENDEDFTFCKLEKFSFPSCFYDFYGILVNYQGNPVYADICEYPYIIMDKQTLQQCGRDIQYIDDFVKRFDDSFMEGKRYIKK